MTRHGSRVCRLQFSFGGPRYVAHASGLGLGSVGKVVMLVSMMDSWREAELCTSTTPLAVLPVVVL